MYWLLCAVVVAATTTEWSFESDTVGQIPSGWIEAHTGEGNGSVWRVVQDGERKALAQTSSAGPDAFFNLCVVNESSYRDLELSVSIKAVSGKNDQGGGVVWRYRDAINYYIARWNPLEDNFRVYKVEGGKRTQFATADVKLPSDCWHTIKVTQTGAQIRCYLDDKLYLRAQDATFPAAGKIGLWTKSDAVSYFDSITVSPLK